MNDRQSHKKFDIVSGTDRTCSENLEFEVHHEITGQGDPFNQGSLKLSKVSVIVCRHFYRKMCFASVIKQKATFQKSSDIRPKRAYLS